MSSQAGKHHQSQPQQQQQQQPPTSQHHQHQHHPQQQQQQHHSQHQPQQQQQPGNNQPQQHSQRYDTGAHHQSGASPNAGGGADAATSSGTAPNVRHIPIYVEGRDEPLINRNIDTKPSAHHVHRSASGSGSSNSANFDWGRKVPTMGGHQSAPPQPQQQQQQHDPMRAHSPHRTSKPVHRSGSAGANNSTAGAQHSQQQQQQQQQHSPGTPSRQQPDSGTMPANGGAKANAADYMSITKIQNIQRDVLNLMDQVERFNGTTRKDRQYMYLDEMLTQNLLKLDTIDTDGKENIKMARREAIRCINKCIGVLEAKADAGAQQAKQAADTAASKNAASRV